MNTLGQTLIHSSAVIHPTALLGADVHIGPYVVLEEDVAIGDGCRFEAHAVVKCRTRMGSHNHVYECAVIGGAPQDFKYQDEPTGLTIGERNTIREGVTIHRATEPGQTTRIGNDNYLMANSHVAHDCVLEDHIVLANNVALAGCVHMEAHAFVSGGVVIHQFCRIGRYSMIGGNSKIIQDVLPYFLIDGVPGRVRGLNLVGLRRGGFSAPEIKDLKRAYRVLLTGGGSLEERLLEMSTIESDHVRHLVSFIRSSKRGFSRA